MTWLSIVGAVLGLVGLLTGALVVALSARQKTTITVLTQEADAYKRQAERLTLERDLAAKDLEVLQRQYDALASLKGAADEVGQLARTITGQHTEVMQALTSLVESLTGSVPTQRPRPRKRTGG